MIARNFLGGRNIHKHAIPAHFEQPEIPFRWMNNYQTRNINGNQLPHTLRRHASIQPDQAYWVITIHVTQGGHKGSHKILVDPRQQKILNWAPPSSTRTK